MGKIRHGLLVLVFAAIAGTIWPSQAYATGRDNADPEAKQIQQERRTVSAAVRAKEIKTGIASLKPPLPFQGPLVGPVIKKFYPNVVDRRTTAFIPRSLANLTPIKMPEDNQRWIRVDLSEQLVVAYEGETPIRAFVVSSGLPGTPTVTGEFHIRAKVRSQTMSGGGGQMYYNLPNVEWVQYFFEDYSFHGTYWHNDFGEPRSHGCVNMTNADAKWLFDWSMPAWNGSEWQKVTAKEQGALVIIHE